MVTQVTTGTYNFNPSLGETVLNAFARIGVRRPEILQTHLADARMEANLLLAKISNTQPNLWAVDLQALPLVRGIATYTVPAETAMILDVYVRFGDVTETDRAMYPISRSEYSTYPQKTLQSFPTVYWYDRLISPTITIWPVPDGSGPLYAFLLSRSAGSGRRLYRQYQRTNHRNPVSLAGCFLCRSGSTTSSYLCTKLGTNP